MGCITKRGRSSSPLGFPKMYEEMAQKSGLGEKEKEYIDEKLKSASWLIKSIQQRQRTIFRVTEKLVERQKEFLKRVLVS